MIKISKEWQEIHSEFIILDPDGWDRKNYDFSWYQQLISEEEYFRRRDLSSSISNPINLNK